MSLKAFHVIFIGAAILLAVGLGMWSLRQHQAADGGWLLLALGSFAAAIGLALYETWFLRKTRGVSPW